MLLLNTSSHLHYVYFILYVLMLLVVPGVILTWPSLSSFSLQNTSVKKKNLNNSLHLQLFKFHTSLVCGYYILFE